MSRFFLVALLLLFPAVIATQPDCKESPLEILKRVASEVYQGYRLAGAARTDYYTDFSSFLEHTARLVDREVVVDKVQEPKNHTSPHLAPPCSTPTDSIQLYLMRIEAGIAWVGMFILFYCGILLPWITDCMRNAPKNPRSTCAYP